MPSSFRPACIRHALLATLTLLASLAPVARAESLSASAQIVGGDVGTARSEALGRSCGRPASAKMRSSTANLH